VDYHFLPLYRLTSLVLDVRPSGIGLLFCEGLCLILGVAADGGVRDRSGGLFRCAGVGLVVNSLELSAVYRFVVVELMLKLELELAESEGLDRGL
jgi:hypothetical protein